MLRSGSPLEGAELLNRPALRVPRCRFARVPGLCDTEVPGLRLVAGDAHMAACHYSEELVDVTVESLRASVDATAEGRSRLEGVVHVDGTARPQVVERGNEMHRILAEYEKLTSLPALVNTSYNMHEEPIVATADDAVRAHKAGGFFHLALADRFLVPPVGPRPA